MRPQLGLRLFGVLDGSCAWRALWSARSALRGRILERMRLLRLADSLQPVEAEVRVSTEMYEQRQRNLSLPSPALRRTRRTGRDDGFLSRRRSSARPDRHPRVRLGQRRRGAGLVVDQIAALSDGQAGDARRRVRKHIQHALRVGRRERVRAERADNPGCVTLSAALDHGEQAVLGVERVSHALISRRQADAALAQLEEIAFSARSSR